MKPDTSLIVGRISLGLALFGAVLLLLSIATSYNHVSEAQMLLFRQETLEQLMIAFSMTSVVTVVMWVGLVLQGFGRFEKAWMVLLIIPVLGIIEFVLSMGFFMVIFGIFATVAAFALRQHAISLRMAAVMGQ